MKKIQIALILALFFLIPVLLNAQNENYDAEYLRLVKEYTLNDDGSYDFHYYKELKLNTHFAFHRLFGETFIVYNPEFQELKINEAYTTMADGKKVDSPKNAFNEVLPGFAHDIAAYNRLREMVVTHTGTEVGAVITLDYTIHTKLGFQPFLHGSEQIGEIVPIHDLMIIVNVPQNIDLKTRMLNNRTAAGVTEKDGKKVYTWSMKDVKALSHSANQDPDQEAILFFSVARDMIQAFYAFVNQDAFKAQPGAEISKRVDSAIKDKTNDLDIILALQEIVVDELKTANVPIAFSGYKVRTPDVVWQSANATELEKAILLADMLKLANINAFPVAVVNNGWYSAEMGNYDVFDSYMVQVNPKETGRIYLPVSGKPSQNMIYDVQDKTMIQLDAAIESMRTFKEKPVPAKMEMEGKLKLEDLGIWGEVELDLEGIVNPFYKLRSNDGYVKNIVSGIPSSSIKNIEVKKISELKSNINFDSEPETGKYGEYLYLELPHFTTGIDSWGMDQFLGPGDTPLRLDFALSELYQFSISLPSDFTMFTPLTEVLIKNDLGRLIINISQSGSTIKVERSWEFYKDVVTADKMEEFKKMIQAWVKTEYRQIVLEKK